MQPILFVYILLVTGSGFCDVVYGWVRGLHVIWVYTVQCERVLTRGKRQEGRLIGCSAKEEGKYDKECTMNLFDLGRA